MEQKRIEYLDFARGLAILFMIFQHAVILYDTNQGESSLLGIIIVLLGTAPAAPVFMVIMGIFFSRKKSVSLSKELKAGLKLIVLGYLLNIFRFVIPDLFTLLESPVHSVLAEQSSLDLFLSVDILQMAGYSWIFMAFLTKKRASHKTLLLLIIVVVFISPLIWSDMTACTPFGTFWGTDKNIYFPLFPWVIYPLMGLILGDYFTSVKRYKDNLKSSALWGVGLLMIGFLLLIFFGEYHLFSAGDYHRSSISIHLMIIGFIGIWFWLCDLLVSFKQTSEIHSIFQLWSKNVTKVYFIQWLLLGWSVILLGENRFSVGVSILFGVVITILTHYILTVLLLEQDRKKDNNKSTRAQR